jgi:hypothetical protein
VARHNRLWVIAALLLLASTACGARQRAASEPPSTAGIASTTSSTTTTTSQPSTEEDTPGQENPCTSGSLFGSIEPMDSAAGGRYVTLVVKNKGQQDCTLKGFGGLELVNYNKEPLPTTANRNLDPQPVLVTLAPGEEAGKILRWTVVPTGDEPTEGPCQPQATGINVQPPDEETSFRVDYEFGSICDHGTIDTSAYFAR